MVICMVGEKVVKSSEGGTIEIEVRDKDGKVIVKRTEKMNSYLYNYYLLVRAGLIRGITGLAVKDTDGNTLSVDGVDFNGGGAMAGEGDDSYGIVVGSGSTQVDVQNDYSLANKISNGTGSGQLSYGSMSFTEDLTNLPKITLSLKRSFVNNSGDSITVSEIGLVIKLVEPNGSSYNVMICRDVITATTVPNGGTLSVTMNLNIN